MKKTFFSVALLVGLMLTSVGAFGAASGRMFSFCIGPHEREDRAPVKIMYSKREIRVSDLKNLIGLASGCLRVDLYDIGIEGGDKAPLKDSWFCSHKNCSDLRYSGL